MLQKFREMMPGKLTAIEIAEGALLADIAVVLQLLTIYLPVAGGYITLLVPIPFTVLVLRRNLYAGIMGLCVAFFVIGMLTGIQSFFPMLLEGGAGLYLGIMMKYRVRDVPLVLLGATGSALLLSSILVITILLSGIPITRTLIHLHRNYDAIVASLGFAAVHIGLGGWWKHNAYPIVISFETLIFTYWLLLIYMLVWLVLCPVVIIATTVTNFFVRLLGYNVRPFPGGILDKLIRWTMQTLIRLALRLGLGKHRLTGTLIKEVRRRGITRRERRPQPPPWYPQGAPVHCDGVADNVVAPLAGTRGGEGSSVPLIDIQHVTYIYPDQKTHEDAPGNVLVPLAGTRGLGANGHENAPGNVLVPLAGTRGVAPALQDVSLQIQQGEYLVILGHNGSGKSTLARHCNALLTPSSGHVLVAGLDTRDKPSQRAIRDKVGMIFQNPDNQIIATVVEDDVAWALTVRGLPASLIAERVEQAMAAVGISDLRELAPHRLSGGQRQRLAIAGVLALRPQCIIADEATSQLDPLSRMEIVSLLHQLNREHGLTIIHVTHLLEEAALAQRVVVMEQGQIAMEGTPATIFADLERLRQLKLAIPAPIELAARLRTVGLPVAQEAVTVEAIAQELVH